MVPEMPTTAAFLPYCLRHPDCPHRIPTANKANSKQCDAITGRCDNNGMCGVGQLACILHERGIEWTIVGHGHGIGDELASRMTGGMQTKVVLGVSCIRSFAEEGATLLGNADLRTQGLEGLVFFPLLEGFNKCPSYVGIKLESGPANDNLMSQAESTVNVPAFEQFLSKVYEAPQP